MPELNPQYYRDETGLKEDCVEWGVSVAHKSEKINTTMHFFMQAWRKHRGAPNFEKVNNDHENYLWAKSHGRLWWPDYVQERIKQVKLAVQRQQRAAAKKRSHERRSRARDRQFRPAASMRM